MMTGWQKISMITSGLALSLTVSPINSVQAAIIPYTFSGTIEFGDLTGESFSGSFNYDDSLLTGSGYEVVDVSDLELTFLGNTFTAVNGDSTPRVEFSEGNFLGLYYSVSSFNPEFSLLPGFSDVSDAKFAYIGSNDAGFGTVQYTVVPEPFTLLGTGTALGLGLLFKRKLKQK
ncbi:conserved hypothetical protein [Gloeothece citriformis PCC 7424]|uniref:PEP-CTERM protein-sorting domain-containing protein n=2 Tax=Gloeothece TaxID=28070 RepID=B7KEF9_GLOC7|nr:conserved hypothetical protein [Gloeothece citriformis PCC 7424]